MRSRERITELVIPTNILNSSRRSIAGFEMTALTYRSCEVACCLPCLEAIVPQPRHEDTHCIPSRPACLSFSLFHYTALHICLSLALPLRLRSGPFPRSLLRCEAVDVIIIDDLALIGHNLSDDEVIVHTLNGLGAVYKELTTIIQACDSSLSFEELYDELTDYKMYLKREDRAPGPPITAQVSHKFKKKNNQFSKPVNKGLGEASSSHNPSGKFGYRQTVNRWQVMLRPIVSSTPRSLAKQQS
ncbi:hypothetical protein GW17_00049986 [Ensete ventricosum]|nr:hypothetical protein GW17_00049986 [Ensete ventricosum]